MNWLVRGFAWWLDYVYVGFWQLRHALGGRDPSRYLGGDRESILLLPGVLETWQFLRPVAERMHRLGHPVYVVPSFGYNTGSIPAMAALAEAFLVENDLRQVTIIAHSKGGLIGKHLMVVDDTDARIRAMIAINAPFGGSRYARYLPGRDLRALSPTGETLVMLAANAVANARITSIFAEFDPHIPEGSHLQEARNVRLPVSGHFRPLGTEEVLRAVQDAVENPPDASRLP